MIKNGIEIIHDVYILLIILIFYLLINRYIRYYIPF